MNSLHACAPKGLCPCYWEAGHRMTTAQEDGSHRAWDQIWSGSLGTESMSMQYFEKGPPSTLRQLWQRCYFDDLWSLMGAAAEGGRYCELGAGRGTTSTYLRARGCDVVMVDLSPTGFELAKQNFKMLGIEPPEMVIADARATQLEGGQFDGVFNIGLMEHFVDPVPVLRETKRLLRRGGLAYLLIVPEIPVFRACFSRGLLNPARFAVNVARSLVRPARQDDMVRTSFEDEQWVSWAREVGASEVQCFPYNPYFPVYRTQLLERRIAVRLYWRHYQFLQRSRSAPRLRCPRPMALCQLLTFRA